MTSVPSSELRDRIAAALSEAGAFCGECGFEPGETGCPDCVRVRAMYTDAVLATVQPELDRLRAELEQAQQQTADRIADGLRGIHDDPDTINDYRSGLRKAIRNIHRLAEQPPAAAPGCGCQSSVHPGHYPSCPTRTQPST